MHYRKKPVEVEAIQFYDNPETLVEFKPDIQVVSGLKKGDYKTHE